MDTEIPHGPRFRREFCWVLQVKGSFRGRYWISVSGPYHRVGLIAAPLFAATVSNSQISATVLFRLGSVPTTPDPNTSAKVSQYKWEAYRDTNWWCIYYFLPRSGHTFAKVSQYKWELYRDTFQKYRGQGSIWLSWSPVSAEAKRLAGLSLPVRLCFGRLWPQFRQSRVLLVP